MTSLSVNINKIATLRNSRGENLPDLMLAARRIQNWGADGITVHPRPDERHIKYDDIPNLRQVTHKEFNIEGNPRNQGFLELVLENKPEQVTLVPDVKGQLTSDHGWNTRAEGAFLREVIRLFKDEGIRVSIFLDPDVDMVEHAAATGTDRIELYTDDYAKNYDQNPQNAIAPYILAAERAKALGLGVNAGHALNLQNLEFLCRNIPYLDEVSIGHAIICDALYMGLENTVQLYKSKLISHV